MKLEDKQYIESLIIRGLNRELSKEEFIEQILYAIKIMCKDAYVKGGNSVYDSYNPPYTKKTK